VKKTLHFLLTGMAILLMASSCGQEKEPVPEDLLDRETFTSLILDIQLAEGLKSQYSRSKSFGKNYSRDIYDDIFIRHGIDEAEFQKTYSWYQGRPDLMEKIYEQVLDSLSTLEAEIKQEYANDTKAMRDSLKSKKSLLQKKGWKGSLNYLPDMSQYDSAYADSARSKKPSK